MFTFRTEGREIRCAFPYRWLIAFKIAVPEDDRRFRPTQKEWAVTVHGFRCLADEWGEQFAPLPLDVLDLAYPPPRNAEARNAANPPEMSRKRTTRRKALEAAA